MQEITNESVFLRRLHFVPVDGFAYTYNRQKTLGGIAFRGLNDSYANDTGVVNPQVETLSIFGGEVRTDRQLVNKQGDAVRANAIAAKVKKAGLFFDRYVRQGRPRPRPATSSTASTPASPARQVIATAHQRRALTLDLLDQALDAVAGSNDRKVIVCNKVVRRKITALLRRRGRRRVDERDRPAGQEYDGAADRGARRGRRRVRRSSTSTRPRAPSNVTTSLYVIRPGSDVDGEHVQGLIGADLIEHVAVGLQGTYYTDIVEANMGLGMFHPRSAARVKGITNT